MTDLKINDKEAFQEWIKGLLENIPDDEGILINCCIEMSYFSGKKEIMVTGHNPNNEVWQKKYPSTRSCFGGTPYNHAAQD